MSATTEARLLGRLLLLLAGALVAPVLAAEPALAHNVLDPDKVAAALALGFQTEIEDAASGDFEVTSMLITNTGSSAIWLAAQVISGDRDDECRSDSFSCVMTAGETTQFVFKPVAGDNSEVTFECSDPTAIPNSSVDDKSFQETLQVSAQRGIMFVTVEDAAGNTLSQNVLEGKSVVMNFEDGTSYTLPAIPFQAIDPAAQDFTTEYEFDGDEYGSFPAAVTTSFHAPDSNDGVEAELFLFTLDMTLSSTETPHVQATVNYWNDDEKRRNASFEFDCMYFEDLDEIALGINQTPLGSQVGHLEIIPQPSLVNDGAHDDIFGNGDDTRRSGIMGWLIQEVETDGFIQDSAGNDISDEADSDMSWANVLTASQTAISPTPGDTEVLSK